MTKNEIINEMYNVVNNNAGVFCYGDKHMIEVHAKYIKTTKKATLEQYLAKLNAMVEEAKIRQRPLRLRLRTTPRRILRI